MIEHALALARRGFHVFPVKAGAKSPPLIKDFPTCATRDEAQLQAWWAKWPAANIGISTSRFGADEALLVVDVDNKGEKDGDASILALELSGDSFPDTYTQSTPTGGKHFVYRVPVAVRNSVEKIASALDVRSEAGYILAAGCRVDSGVYEDVGGRVASAPHWLTARCGNKPAPSPVANAGAPSAAVDRDAALDRSRKYLEHDAPLAIEGQGGDATTYTVACRVRDFGVDAFTALQLLDAHWNERCSPPWDAITLGVKVGNAYEYAQDAAGNAAPETVFVPISGTDIPNPGIHPFDKLNKDHAYLIKGDTVLFETTDENGRSVTEHLNVAGFDRTHAAWKMQVGKRSEPVTRMWMEHPSRRTYERIVFAPKVETPTRFYNLWRGFSVEPAASSDHPAVHQWLEHARDNICQGDAALFKWLIAFFAHMVQRPWEKPLVALVFKGGKGVGKNALVTAVAGMLGPHSLLSSNRRYLVGNFNGHLENLILFVLDEAFWSGDKQAEGTLKDIITGEKHVIEHKGKEPYTVANLARVAILGNESWLVPASHDERRFAVFNVGDGRKQDRRYFSELATGMAAGGSSALLRYLLDVDISKIDISQAPISDGLLDQKLMSLEPFSRWWFSNLRDGMIHGSEHGTEWPDDIEVKRFETAYRTWLRDNNVPARLPSSMIAALNAFSPSITRKKIRVGSSTPYAYHLPKLPDARMEWDRHMGQSVTWE